MMYKIILRKGTAVTDTLMAWCHLKILLN